MSDFFHPPPSGPTEEAKGGDPPPWTGRPQGSPPGEVLSELLLSRSVIELLAEHTAERSWWLTYLDTGASDVVFPYAPRIMMYSGWGYVLVEAGPQQASSWREADFRGALPDLMFPKDRSWLVSTLWDDDWSSIGGSEQLVSRLLAHPGLAPMARRVAPGEDATPPGHETR